jgi:carboxylate-amine ligase
VSYGMFTVHGVEIEYAIVNADSLEVLPIADWLIAELADEVRQEAMVEDLVVSNELTLHVVELKVPQPASRLEALPSRFQRAVRTLNGVLARENAMLLPGGMHPLMDPTQETWLWPHQDAEIYREFHRHFDCHRHGWANLQSTHLNLPFANDDEFSQLHAAVRVVLPLVPALAASSPIVEGQSDGTLCRRLSYYRAASASVPTVTGGMIPEAVFSREEYEARVLAPIRDDLERLGATGVLAPEWVNARAAIARFDRGSIEIRMVDSQEHALADIAVAAAIIATVQALVAERWGSAERLRGWGAARLDAVLREVSRGGGEAVIDDEAYLRIFGIRAGPATAAGVWGKLVGELFEPDSPWVEPLNDILDSGCLAARILERCELPLRRAAVLEVYRELARCLDAGEPFTAQPTRAAGGPCGGAPRAAGWRDRERRRARSW